MYLSTLVLGGCTLQTDATVQATTTTPTLRNKFGTLTVQLENLRPQTDAYGACVRGVVDVGACVAVAGM